MAKQRQNTKLMFGLDIEDPQDAIHMGAGKRIRLEDVPESDANGDKQVGNREYNDARYQAKAGSAAKTTRWITPLVVQWSGAGLVYNYSQASYEIEGYDGIFTVLAGQKTLVSADPSNPRFDRFAANVDQEVVVIEGTPSSDPAEPALPFPDTQIAGPVVLVGAGATEPDPGETPSKLVFNENAGHPSEFAGSFSGSGSANFNGTLFPYSGFKAIDVSNVQNNSYLEFIADTDFNPADFDSLGMQLRLKGVMANGYNLRVRYYNNAGTAISNEATLSINKGLSAVYQFVAATKDQFTFSATNARRIRLRWTRGSGTVTYAGFYLDMVRLQGGILPSVVEGDVNLNGHVSGSGQTGSPINVTITEKAISEQTEQTDPLSGDEHILGRLSSGMLVKIPVSLLVTAGDDGREIELQNNGTHIQWRYVGDPDWINLVALADITGDDGDDGTPVELQVDGTMLQWRYVGAPTWTDLFDLSTLSGGGSMTPEAIRDALETLTDEERLSATAIKDLPAVEPVQDEYTWTSGAQEFTLSEANVGKPVVYVNSTHLRESKWTITAGVVTITDTLPNPSVVVIRYFKTVLIGGYPEYGFSGEQFYQIAGTIFRKGGYVLDAAPASILLTFRKDTGLGTPAAPLDGSISETFADPYTPNVGAKATLWYNDTALSLDSKYVIEPDSPAFDNTKLNRIVFTYYSNSFITYRITLFDLI